MALIGGRGARRGLLLCLAVSAALAAAGCTGSSATPETIYITPGPGSGASGANAGSSSAPAGSVTPVIDSVVIDSAAPDGSWKVTFKKPVVSGIPDAAANKINDAVTAKVNGLIAAFTGGNLPATAGAGPSTLEGDYTIALDSPTLISLRFTLFTNLSGSAQPKGTPGSINFVVSSGAAINLADIFSDPTGAVPTLSSKAHAALASSLGADLTWAGPATSMSFFDKAWAMTSAGLEFTWPQGDLASTAAGMPTATLPWSSIKSLIKPSGPAGEFAH